MTRVARPIAPRSWAHAGVALMSIVTAARGVGYAIELGTYLANNGSNVWPDKRSDVVGLALHAGLAMWLWMRAARIATAVFPHSDDTDPEGLERIMSAALVVAGLALAASTIQSLVYGAAGTVRPFIDPAFGAEGLANFRRLAAVQLAGATITAAAGVVLATRSRAIARAAASPLRRVAD